LLQLVAEKSFNEEKNLRQGEMEIPNVVIQNHKFMIKKIMTIRTAGSTPPPRNAQATITTVRALGKKSVKKVWKKLVARFKAPPTKAQLSQKKAAVQKHYDDAAKLFQARLRQRENDPAIRIKVVINWEKINPLKYYIVVLMLRLGPGNDSISPPQSPTPPKSPM